MTTPETEFINILGTGAPGAADASGTKIWSKALPETLPILGLSDIVIFPARSLRCWWKRPRASA